MVHDVTFSHSKSRINIGKVARKAFSPRINLKIVVPKLIQILFHLFVSRVLARDSAASAPWSTEPRVARSIKQIPSLPVHTTSSSVGRGRSLFVKISTQTKDADLEVFVPLDFLRTHRMSLSLVRRESFFESYCVMTQETPLTYREETRVGVRFCKFLLNCQQSETPWKEEKSDSWKWKKKIAWSYRNFCFRPRAEFPLSFRRLFFFFFMNQIIAKERKKNKSMSNSHVLSSGSSELIKEMENVGWKKLKHVKNSEIFESTFSWSGSGVPRDEIARMLTRIFHYFRTIFGPSCRIIRARGTMKNAQLIRVFGRVYRRCQNGRHDHVHRNYVETSVWISRKTNQSTKLFQLFS